MRETALAYVRHGGNAVAMAAELHIHPQTARYRIARLRELLGEQLDDPDARFELELVLRPGPPARALLGLPAPRVCAAGCGRRRPRAARRRRSRSGGPGSGGACGARAAACRTSSSARSGARSSACSRRRGSRAMKPPKSGKAGVAEDQPEGERRRAPPSGIETDGGITSRSLSLGWSWWMPWMMKCIRRPKALSGSQWKTSRCSQYSVSVQIPTPAEGEQGQLPGARSRGRPRATPSRRSPGRRSIAGIAGVDAGEEVEELALEERRRGGQLVGAVVCLHLAAMLATPATAARPARRGEVVTKAVSKRLRFAESGLTAASPTVLTCPRRCRASPKPPTCEDCYFHKNLLCALELDEPCATFRPNRPEGLVPPRQPVLLMRAPRWAAPAAPLA